MRMLVSLFLALTLPLTSPAAPAVETHDYDLVVYGGTSAGVIAAVQAKRGAKPRL